MAKECYSCAARDGQTDFPERKGRRRLVCCECLTEKARSLVGDRVARPVMLTRASWRARERARKASPQYDMIDWLSA